MAKKHRDPDGVILYEGPSQIDGEPIVAIGSPFNKASTNKKTGDMLQVWVLAQDYPPLVAINEGHDYSICGDCPARGYLKDDRNRGRWCYVVVRNPVRGVYDAYQNGRYELLSPRHFPRLAERPIRITAYGDPAAVSFEVWEELIELTPGHTGYTHLWRTADPRLRHICMASVETAEGARQARDSHWRYFFVSQRQVEREERAVIRCPASREQEHPLTCVQCLACHGTQGNGGRASVVIGPHGGPAAESVFRKKYGS